MRPASLLPEALLASGGMSTFYWPVVMWVEYPALTLVPVAVFGAAFWHVRQTDRRSRGLLVVMAIWLLYATYEGVMFVWAQQVVAPIRIDLIVLGPAMYIVTAFGVLSWWRAVRGNDVSLPKVRE